MVVSFLVTHYRWFVYALLGALFAAIVNVLTKKALQKTDATLAITVQAVLMLVTVSLITTFTGGWSKFGEVPGWALGLTAVAGVFAGLAWYFGYQALGMTEVSRATTVDRLSLPLAVILAMVFMKEKPSGLNWAGVGLMLVGAICVAQSSGK